MAPMPHPLPRLTPHALWSLLLDAPQELALLDVRETRAYAEAHPNLARNAPLSSLELQAGLLVPRHGTPVVLYDGDGAEAGPAAAAGALLQRLGYSRVRVLDGGLARWQAAGLPVIDGFGTLVKAFGDLARLHYGTPALSGEALQARLRDGLPTTVVDVRPAAERAFLTLPGGRHHAGTELALRAPAAPGHLWAVHCFSRTRGIIGTTTLRLLGHAEATFVEDGVMAWGLRGAPVVQNAEAALPLPPLPDSALRAQADRLHTRHALTRLDNAGLAAWSADGDRSLYVFDVRPSADPALAGTRVRHVPGGQLFMHFENLIGTRGARVVLIDDPHRLRATVTAFWLSQLGQFDVAVLDDTPDARTLGTAPAVPGADTPGGLDAATLRRQVAAGAVTVVDVGPSLDYVQGHVPGALYLLPFTLDPLADVVAEGRPIVFTSPDGHAARLVARDARVRWPAASFDWLAGAPAAYGALDTDDDASRRLTPFEDDWGSVMRVFGPRRNAVWAHYLAWERGLAQRVRRDASVRFRFFDRG